MADGAEVELLGIGKTFGEFAALRDVSVTLRPGRIHALVGENGAGKSTLGKIVAGLVSPDTGRHLVDGEPVEFRSPRDALRYGITTISQELTLVPRMGVLQNVVLGREPRRRGVLDDRAARDRFGRLSERVGFVLDPDTPVGRLRVADQQKVEVLRAVSRGARLVVFDEPTAALAGEEAARLFEIVRGLSAQGVTIVYVSHFLDEVLALCDTVTVLRDGELVRTAPAAGETAAGLVTSMLGRSLDVAHPPKVPAPAGAPEMLVVRGLGRAGAVRDVSLAVRAGEIVGVAGLVGAGRTELARTIFGAEPADSGTIAVAGRELAVRRPLDAMRAGIALVPEDRATQGLVLRRPIAENVTLAALSTITRGGVLRSRVERDVVDGVARDHGIRRRSWRTPVSGLSGGNQQKVVFAKWLLRRPRVLIVDELTRGVDVGAKIAIYELIVELAAAGTAVVLISSEMDELLGLAHRVLVMRDRTVVAELSGEAMTEDAIGRAAFGATDAPATTDAPLTDGPSIPERTAP